MIKLMEGETLVEVRFKEGDQSQKIGHAIFDDALTLIVIKATTFQVSESGEQSLREGPIL